MKPNQIFTEIEKLETELLTNKSLTTKSKNKIEKEIKNLEKKIRK